MKSNPFLPVIACLAILALPSFSRAATPPPHFTGPSASFAGLYPNNEAELTVTLGANGKFTGKLSVAFGHVRTLRGTLDTSGSFSGLTGAPATPFTLVLTGTTVSTYVLNGSAKGDQITAYPAVYSKTNPAVAAKYTTLFTGTDPSIGVPQGTGYATIAVSKTGAGSVTGKLADGTSFSSSGLIVAGPSGHELLIFDTNIYGKKGLFSGALQIVDQQFAPVDVQDSAVAQTGIVQPFGSVRGNVLWIKPSVKGPYYATRFNTTVNAQGFRFDKTQPIPFTTGTLTVSDPSLGSPITQAFTVTTAGAVTISGTNPNNVKLAFKLSTGAITGSFEPVAGEKKPTIKFAGLLLQDPAAPEAAGYFLTPAVSGTGLSGNVTLP
jgi:hypothetical protein